MFEMLRSVAAAWRTVVHVSEWSGLSIGVLAALVALFLYVPIARRFVIAAAITVLLCWICLIHADRVGRADVNAQWAEARKAAIAAEQERDTMVELQLAAKYQPKLAELQKQADERKARAEANERKIATPAKGNASGKAVRGACLLGAAADRVPGWR